MGVGEKLFSGVVLALCMAMLLRLCLGERRRERVDAALRGFGLRLQRLALGARQWRRWRQTRAAAAREAEAAILRARRRSQREGNVIRPDSFRKPRKPH
jgi:hypothetical protein